MHAKGMAETTCLTTRHQALIKCSDMQEKNVNNNIWCSPSGYLPNYHITATYLDESVEVGITKIFEVQRGCWQKLFDSRGGMSENI